MKCKVVKRFIDKNTKKLHETSTIYECSNARFSEIQKEGKFLLEVKEPRKEEPGKAQLKEK